MMIRCAQRVRRVLCGCDIQRFSSSYVKTGEYPAYKCIDLEFSKGQCKFGIPVPLNGLDRVREFIVPTTKPLKYMIEMIKEESDAVTTVEISSVAQNNANILDKDTLIEDMLSEPPFRLIINGHTMLMQSSDSIGSAIRV